MVTHERASPWRYWAMCMWADKHYIADLSKIKNKNKKNKIKSK
jgi:hypothetical protein